MRRVAVLFLLAAATASAQPLLPVPGGSIILTDSSPPTVSMYDPVTGSTAVLTNASTLVIPAGCVVTYQRDVVFTDWIGISIYRVDVLGNLTTVATGLLNQPTRVAQDHNGDIIYTGNAWGYAPASLMRVDSLGSITTIAVLAGNPFDVKVENTGALPSGDFLVTLPLFGQLIRVDGAGGVTTLATGLASPIGVDTFPNGDYAVALSSTDEIVRIPRAGGTPTTWVPSSQLGNIKDLVADGEGGFFVTEAGGALGARLMRVDAGGNVTQVLGNAAFGFFQGAAHSPHLNAPLAPGTGLNGLFGLAIDFPAMPTMPYTTIVSGSLFPGITFTSGDPRATPLNPDSLFLQSFGIGFPGITAGWVGVLDGSGQGVITMNLTPFPAGAFAGTRVHIQVGVIDVTAPTSIGAMSAAETLLFQ